MKKQDEVINWLLEKDNPPVRYLTLTKLLKKSETDLEVKQAKEHLMEYDVTQAILEHSEKFWKDDDRAYWKYTGKYWQVIFLGQFLADGREAQTAVGVTDLLKSRKWVMASGGQYLTANLLAAFRRLGYGDNPVVFKETESLAKRIVTDGGLKCTAMDYSLLPLCYMALPKQLLSFAEIPAQKRSENVKAAIDLVVETILKNEVYLYSPSTRREWQKIIENAPKRSELPKGQTVKEWIGKEKDEFLKTQGIGSRIAKPGWSKFGFPLHYNSNILEAMYALAMLEIPMSPNLEKPLEIIKNKMTPDGKWILENSLNGKMWIDVEEKRKPSKWLTYFAYYVLDHFGL